MKLGMLIPEFPTQTHVFFWREIEALRELGVEVHVISTKRPDEPCPHAFAQTAIEQTHYLYPLRKMAMAQSLFRWNGLASCIQYILSLSGNISRKARVVGYLLCAMDLARYSRKHGLNHIHVHSCADAAHIAAMARMLNGAPYSLHLHGDLPVYGTDHPQKSSRATFVAAAARSMQQQLIDLAEVPAERTYTMWMGVDTSHFHPQPATGKRGESLHMVSVGRLHLCKGHRYTLQALRRLLDRGANIRYTIAGSGPHQKEIAASVAEGNFGDRVRRVGSLGEAEVHGLLQSADVFILSSVGLGEASPVAVMEAMAAGVPVISSIIGGTPDMITDGIDGLLVKQEDVEGLEAAMLRVHHDESLRLRMSDAARTRACTQFDYHATSSKLLVAIQKTLQ